MKSISFDPDLIRRYDIAGPRYTSYPTAVSFKDFSAADYISQARQSNEDLIPLPLSLYFHIPFCATVCFYCACNKIVTKNREQASLYLNYLFREIELQAALYDPDRRVNQLHWGGGTPTFLNHAQIAALMTKTRQHFNLLTDDSGDYSIEIDPRSVNAETIQLLREQGFNRFSLGVQDIDERVQRAINRIQPTEQTLEIIQTCRAQGAKSISVDLIYGLPLQTLAGFSQTLETVIDWSPDRISLFNYAHLPTLFMPQRRINSAELPSSEEKLQILQHAVQQLTAAGYVYIGMDHFAKPNDELALAQEHGSLHRNFQGYTTHADCDLVAMGVSAISNVADCYSQNEKTTDAYYAALDAGRLAVTRGVTLTEDDHIRRYVIQQLTCQFAVDLKTVENEFKIDAASYFKSELAQLASMQADHLLEIDGSNLTITPRGRFLVRNICMTFDASLKQASATQRFSKVI
ncbi:oxygen-independent coproporphyrinogen III oxidase [uncultured Thiothrix sp.]|jgi:oxygen-independent coproporphyrinogen-3 oxidase|uniref:oxygen-independent coproporphyrinogen III oxidase n=1 Tax=uncultured Thiothrix sp. TaxID=223185 RepID=UPI0026077C6B|nr:oxygen-independent coproporphyrinogen III oxidase [uncultured Thiothrix sp.]HMT92937.1 oxygen-independent coproporphyrinogen III oxidase [Thiolinea sp.]